MSIDNSVGEERTNLDAASQQKRGGSVKEATGGKEIDKES